MQVARDILRSGALGLLFAGCALFFDYGERPAADSATPCDGEPEQTPGDCRNVVCQDGVSRALVDDDDLPDDEDPCTDDLCVDGAPQHPLLPEGTSCGAGMLACDATGACVGCVLPEECPGVDEPCRGRSCEDGVCGLADAMDGADCDDGLYCTGADTCVGGECIAGGSPCPGPDGDTNCQESCNEVADDCTALDGVGAACNDGTFCNGPDTCDLLGACTGHAGDPCPGSDFDADCAESCNESTDDCTADDPNGDPCGGIMCCLGGNCVDHPICTA